MKSVLVRFQEYEAKVSGAERLVVRFIQEHPKESSAYSIHQLAEASFSSASTIVRLCKKMGFSGYKEFQKVLIAEMSIREESDNAKNQDIQKDDKLENLIAKVTYKNIVSLEKTRKLLDEEVVKQCVDLLGECRNICFFGIGSSLLVAQDAYMKFLRIGKICFVHDDCHVQFLHAKNLSSKDVAIIISYSGLTEEMIRCAEMAKEKGASVIAVTRFADSKLARIADYKLYVAASEVLIRSGAMSSRISQLNVVDILYTAYLNQHFEETAMQVKKTYIPKGQDKDS
ncbi:MAG: MurR/RpiR family transcriptional regulator [Hespellia sp.]|nr:MurR/RpiR family transcriptional regulator [Hespellia sp.]